jgi:hypothetical protein
MILAGILTFGVCLFASNYFDTIELPKYIFESIKIVLISGLCLIIYTIFNLLFKMTYAKELFNRIKLKR